MKYKSIVSACAALSSFFAVAFVSAPDVFTFNLFPSAEGLALEVGIVKRYMIAAMALMGAVTIFCVRQVSDVNSQRSILLGLGVGFMIPFCNFNSVSWVSQHPSAGIAGGCDRVRSNNVLQRLI